MALVGPWKKELKKMAREVGSHLGNEVSKPSELPAYLHDLILNLDCHSEVQRVGPGLSVCVGEEVLAYYVSQPLPF